MLTALTDTSVMPELCVNIDHVATVRQARRTYEPDPVLAATEAEAGGADGITVHLREDRRHIQDSDLPRLKEVVRTKLNLEMAATEEMVAIAIALKPQLSMFVPERRAEVTTEGGLDVAGQEARIREAIARLKGSGIAVSAFIDAILKAKPTGGKGSYIRKISLSSTMGPGLKIDVSSVTGGTTQTAAK